MKKTVGLMLITLVCSLAAMAQTTVWPGVDYTTLIDNNPTSRYRDPANPKDNARILTPSAEAKKFFLYHVKSGKFLYSGGTWDTKTVLKYYDYGVPYSLCADSGYLYIVSPIVNVAGGGNASCLAFVKSFDEQYNERVLNTGFYNDKGANVHDVVWNGKIGKGTVHQDARLIFERVETDASATTFTYKIRITNPKQYMTLGEILQQKNH